MNLNAHLYAAVKDKPVTVKKSVLGENITVICTEKVPFNYFYSSSYLAAPSKHKVNSLYRALHNPRVGNEFCFHN